jgi:hypothetical protein
MLIERFKFFDKDTRPRPPEENVKAEPATPVARRRRYAHTFSAGRTLKLMKGANGHNRWRRMPDGALVWYGKQQLNTKSHSYQMK